MYLYQKYTKHIDMSTTRPTANSSPLRRDTETSRTVIVRLEPETHKALRVRVAEEDTSIQQWVEALVERELGIKKALKAS